ncbi:EF-hand domain-containing protein [Sphingomonas psychrolutea]|uniref:EF-hand domain-containing protein n=1 Tax=Sphingomonas psychrolutea TaxID=1259676 RepID=A0ABQ1GMR6_9SPHN|nr:EF-hand domain-containing protein [Sphingomonas psychrolutea]GGA46883.1 hypothetical protein GCM10011395_16370 [Sphingomonas psychrolutea]
MRVLPVLMLAFAAPLSAQTAPTVAPPPLTPQQRQPAATIVAEPAAMFIAACDANGDGRTTRDELTACVARSFADADSGHVGSIGYIGYADWALKWLGDRNALPSPFGVDRDGDNRITLPELEAQFASLFDRFDVDKDNAATRAELLTIRAGAFPEGGSSKKGRGRGAEPR